MFFGLYIQVSVVLACNFCYVVCLNHQKALLIDISSIYTSVGSLSLRLLLYCVS